MDRSDSFNDNFTNSSTKKSPYVADQGNGSLYADNSNWVIFNGGNGGVLRNNPGKRISLEWTSQELFVLEDLLTKYASDSSSLRYAKIAVMLEEKNIRDVALLCRWMTRKESGKRRKVDNSSSRKKKIKKEKDGNPSSRTSLHVTDRAYAPPFAQTANPMDNDDGIYYKDIGVTSDDLIKQNAEVLNKISNNFSVFRIHDNLELFRQAKNNFIAILNDLKEMPGVMNRMPPLPVKLDEELINSVIPPKKP